MYDSSDSDVSDDEMEALWDILAETSVQEEKKSMDDVVPDADDWAMIMGANNFGISGQFNIIANKAKVESRYGKVGYRNSTPGAAAEFSAHARPTVIRIFLTKQSARGRPNNPMEARSVDDEESSEERMENWK